MINSTIIFTKDTIINSKNLAIIKNYNNSAYLQINAGTVITLQNTIIEAQIVNFQATLTLDHCLIRDLIIGSTYFVAAPVSCLFSNSRMILYQTTFSNCSGSNGCIYTQDCNFECYSSTISSGKRSRNWANVNNGFDDLILFDHCTLADSITGASCYIQQGNISIYRSIFTEQITIYNDSNVVINANYNVIFGDLSVIDSGEGNWNKSLSSSDVLGEWGNYNGIFILFHCINLLF